MEASFEEFGGEDGAVLPSTLANVEALFLELAAIYGARFADMWRNTDVAHVKRVWGRALSGFRMGEVRQGLLRCQRKSWPPTLPEFLLLCRAEPDYESLFVEAQLQAWRRASGEDVWEEPAIFWAAYAFGFFELKMASWQTAKVRWPRIVDEKRDKAAVLPPVPKAMPALPDAGVTFSGREQARLHLAGLKVLLRKGCPPDGAAEGCDAVA